MAAMSDPDRNPQHRRGHNWFAEERKKPPPNVDVRQRRPEVQQGASPVTNEKPEEAPNIARQRDSRTDERITQHEKTYRGAGRPKSSPRHQRRQPNLECVVKIAHRFLA